MSKDNKPNVGIFLNRRLFNTLVWVLTQFGGTEKEVGVTMLSRESAALKFKIMKYARLYKSGSTDCAALYFFPKEAAVLTEILTSFFSLGRKDIPDYYGQIEGRKKGVQGDFPPPQ